MKNFPAILIGICLLTVLSCKEEPKVKMVAADPVVSTFYFIRHAEKDRYIYSTDYERSKMTAAPTAVKRDITVQYYDPAIIDLEQFKNENLGKNVLVVGHSNTTPALVNRMIGDERFSQMDDTDNGSLFMVTLIGSHSAVSRLSFNCNCPE